MFNQLRCADTGPHDSHSHDVDVEITCSGLTPCGGVQHPPHELTVKRERWCEGICGWCYPFEGSRGVHGAGAHK